MAHQVDRVLDDIDKAMAELRRAIRGVPARRQAFKANHDRMAREVARLAVALADTPGAVVTGENRRRKR